MEFRGDLGRVSRRLRVLRCCAVRVFGAWLESSFGISRLTSGNNGPTLPKSDCMNACLKTGEAHCHRCGQYPFPRIRQRRHFGALQAAAVESPRVEETEINGGSGVQHRRQLSMFSPRTNDPSTACRAGEPLMLRRVDEAAMAPARDTPTLDDKTMIRRSVRLFLALPPRVSPGPPTTWTNGNMMTRASLAANPMGPMPGSTAACHPSLRCCPCGRGKALQKAVNLLARSFLSPGRLHHRSQWSKRSSHVLPKKTRRLDTESSVYVGASLDC